MIAKFRDTFRFTRLVILVQQCGRSNRQRNRSSNSGIDRRIRRAIPESNRAPSRFWMTNHRCRSTHTDSAASKTLARGPSVSFPLSLRCSPTVAHHQRWATRKLAKRTIGNAMSLPRSSAIRSLGPSPRFARPPAHCATSRSKSR